MNNPGTKRSQQASGGTAYTDFSVGWIRLLFKLLFQRNISLLYTIYYKFFPLFSKLISCIMMAHLKWNFSFALTATSVSEINVIWPKIILSQFPLALKCAWSAELVWRLKFFFSTGSIRLMYMTSNRSLYLTINQKETAYLHHIPASNHSELLCNLKNTCLCRF